MSGLNNRYWRLFEENKNTGEQISTHIGGAGKDACAELKQPLSEIFKEWRKEWQKQGLLPKRKKRGSS
jgi:hypothetical protein